MTDAKATAPFNPIERSVNLKERAYREIKQRLVSGQLSPQIVYSASQVADLLGVSRSPVREALLELAAEGYLIIDSRGFKVRQFTRQEIKDIFEARAIIEGHVVARLVGRLSTADFQQLQQQYRQMNDRACQGDVAGFLEADKEFHMTLVRRHGNLRLVLMMENLQNFVCIFGLKAIAHQGRIPEVIAEHQSILVALRKKDRKTAYRAMRHHLASTAQYLLVKRPVQVGQKV